MMTSQLKTFLLLGLLSGLIIVLGGMFGGRSGIVLALGFSLLMNAGSYWYSDRIVLGMYRARELAPEEAPYIHQAVSELARQANIPTPRLCLGPEDAPNAFATGRDPAHGVVCVTQGIVRLLAPEELKGVLAHEISHIANRDILIQTVAGVMASAIVAIANFMQFAAIFGGRNSEGERSNPLAMILMAMLAPLAAALIRMAISRSREYLADDTGARLSGQPLALAGALQKLAAMNERIPMRGGNPSTENLFIVAPLFGGNAARLFSTHPDIHERIARLRAMAGR
jgi:heat shock protein HtpX